MVGAVIRVRFACGHDGAVGESVDAPPKCACGERQIVRTFTRAPHFRGSCSGPYAETVAVDPGIVNLTTAGPLSIKQES